MGNKINKKLKIENNDSLGKIELDGAGSFLVKWRCFFEAQKFVLMVRLGRSDGSCSSEFISRTCTDEVSEGLVVTFSALNWWFSLVHGFDLVII